MKVGKQNPNIVNTLLIICFPSTIKIGFLLSDYFYIWFMKKISIVGVPEHFNLPWLRLVDRQPLKDHGVLLEWNDEPRGSGAMIKALRGNEVDLAVVLTESFVRDKIEGNTGEIIGFHVVSPLIWGVHVSGLSPINNVNEISEGSFLVSRMGSGSHLMAFLLAKQQGWDLSGLAFDVIDNLDGAREAFRQPLSKMFMWEKYTTQPLVNSGEFKRIGEIPTPWPCFAMVASEKALHDFPDDIKLVRDLLYEENKKLMEERESSITTIHERYNIALGDVRSWFSQTVWANEAVVDRKILEETTDTLLTLGLVQQKIPAKKLVNNYLAELV